MRNKRIALNAAICVVTALLLLAAFIQANVSGRVLAAALLLPSAILSCIFLKKRAILSINKRTVLLIVSLTALLYVCLYCLSGLYFGFISNGTVSIDVLWKFVLPIVLSVVSGEIARYVILSQNDALSAVLSYVWAVVSEVLIYSTFRIASNFYGFMDLVGMAFLPAVSANVLYHYLSPRFGPVPIAVYRLVTSLYAFLIPIRPNAPGAIVALVNLILPLGMYFFINALFEKKKRYALKKKNKFTVAVSAVAAFIMISVIMLISNQFRFGTLVIATESMAGEINVGDALVFEKYGEQIITEGDILVFDKNNTTYVHRVVEIERINGENRYYTKGDANEVWDSGYITDTNIIGISQMKIPYVGYPTLWLRNIFTKERG